MSITKANRAFWKAFWAEKTQSYLLHLTREETLSQYRISLDVARNYQFHAADLADWPGQVYLIESADGPVQSNRSSSTVCR